MTIRQCSLASALLVLCSLRGVDSTLHLGSVSNVGNGDLLLEQAEKLEHQAAAEQASAVKLRREVEQEKTQMQKQQAQLDGLAKEQSQQKKGGIQELVQSRTKALAEAEKLRKQAAAANQRSAALQDSLEEWKAKVQDDQDGMQRAGETAKNDAARLEELERSGGDENEVKASIWYYESEAAAFGRKLDADKEQLENVNDQVDQFSEEAKEDLAAANVSSRKADELSHDIEKAEAAVKQAASIYQTVLHMKAEVLKEKGDVHGKEVEAKELEVHSEIDSAKALKLQAEASAEAEKARKAAAELARKRAAELEKARKAAEILAREQAAKEEAARKAAEVEKAREAAEAEAKRKELAKEEEAKKAALAAEAARKAAKAEMLKKAAEEARRQGLAKKEAQMAADIQKLKKAEAEARRQKERQAAEAAKAAEEARRQREVAKEEATKAAEAAKAAEEAKRQQKLAKEAAAKKAAEAEEARKAAKESTRVKAIKKEAGAVKVPEKNPSKPIATTKAVKVVEKSPPKPRATKKQADAHVKHLGKASGTVVGSSSHHARHTAHKEHHLQRRVRKTDALREEAEEEFKAETRGSDEEDAEGPGYYHAAVPKQSDNADEPLGDEGLVGQEDMDDSAFEDSGVYQAEEGDMEGEPRDEEEEEDDE